MQKNWIGRSEGLITRFVLDQKTAPNGQSELKIYTTRPDTLMGASFLAIAPDHPLAAAAAEEIQLSPNSLPSVSAVVLRKPKSILLRSMGFDTGIKALHPFDSSWTLPVYVANFVLMEYGTGAIFGCPAHDQRDFEFAIKYDLPILEVLSPAGAIDPTPKEERDYARSFDSDPDLTVEIFETEHEPYSEVRYFKITKRAFDVGASEKYISQARCESDCKRSKGLPTKLFHSEAKYSKQERREIFLTYDQYLVSQVL